MYSQRRATQTRHPADPDLGDQHPNNYYWANNQTNTEGEPTTIPTYSMYSQQRAIQTPPPVDFDLGDSQPPNNNWANDQTSTEGEISADQEIQGCHRQPTTREAIKDDLKILSNVLTSIERDFNNVTTSVMGLDDKNILSVPFTSNWKNLHDRYTWLMNAFQRIAADISNELENFLTVSVKMLRNERVPLERKKNHLSKYMQKLSLFTGAAGENSQNFLRFRQDVIRFKYSLLEEVKNEEPGDNQLEQVENIGRFASFMQAPSGILQSRSMHNEFAEVVVEVNELGLVTLERLNEKLNGIEYIWELLRNDGEALLRKLSDMTEVEHDFEFNFLLNTMEAVYLELKDSLDDFALAVSE